MHKCQWRDAPLGQGRVHQVSNVHYNGISNMFYDFMNHQKRPSIATYCVSPHSLFAVADFDSQSVQNRHTLHPSLSFP